MEMEGARIPRTKKENSNLKNISLCILFVLVVQVIIMLIPITTAGVIYTNNRENFIALGSLEGTRLVRDVNHLPISELGIKSNKVMDDARDTLQNTMLIIEKLKLFSNSSDVVNDIQTLILKTFTSLDDMSDLLNPKMRGTIKRILNKFLRMIENMNDVEIHELIVKLRSVSERANVFLSLHNQNKTFQAVNDADVALKKMDKMLSKFVN